jgi:hypothetical protein
VATIIVNVRSWTGRGQPATLLLHKPVTTFTLLGVICECPVRAMENLDVNKPWPDGGLKFMVKPIEAVQDVLLDQDGRLLSVTQDWKTNIRVDIKHNLNNILDSPESLVELLSLAGRRSVKDNPRVDSPESLVELLSLAGWRSVKDNRPWMQTGRICECRLSYGLNDDTFLDGTVDGLSKFEFSLDRDAFAHFLDLVNLLFRVQPFRTASLIVALSQQISSSPLPWSIPPSWVIISGSILKHVETIAPTPDSSPLCQTRPLA